MSDIIENSKNTCPNCEDPNLKNGEMDKDGVKYKIKICDSCSWNGILIPIGTIKPFNSYKNANGSFNFPESELVYGKKDIEKIRCFFNNLRNKNFSLINLIEKVDKLEKEVIALKQRKVSNGNF